VGTGCVLIPDPDGPRRRDEIARAARGVATALGPSGTPDQLPASWWLASTALRATAGDDATAAGPVRAEDHLVELLLSDESRLVGRIAAQRLGPFESLTPTARRRLEKTALAYVQQRGNAAAMARVMHVHPQTARYRLARLRELLGGEVDTPDTRFELEIALRARRVSLP
jgi:DNA-binding PucR family transcriptional regulator